MWKCSIVLWVVDDQWRKNWKFKYKLLFLTPEAAVEDKVQVKWKIQSGDSKLSLRRSHLELLRGNGLDPALLFVRISYSPQDRGPCHILDHNPCWLHDQDPGDKSYKPMSFIRPGPLSYAPPSPMLDSWPGPLLRYRPGSLFQPPSLKTNVHFMYCLGKEQRLELGPAKVG